MYTLQKHVKHRLRRTHIFTTGMHDLWQADLVDMQSLSSRNDGYILLLTCIDTSSKYAHVRTVKNKSGQSITDAFKSILNEEILLML